MNRKPNLMKWVVAVVWLAAQPLRAATIKQANELMARGEWHAAAVAFEEAGLQPLARKEGWRLNNWGYCLLQAEKAIQACEVLEKAVAADPRNFTTWSNLGVAYETVGDKVKAIDTYRRALELIRSENTAWLSSRRDKSAEAKWYSAALALTGAVEVFEEHSCKLKGEELQAALKAASRLLDEGKFAEAAAAYEKIGITSPAKREGWRLNNWGMALIRAGDYAKAVSRLRKSTEIFPDNPKAWNNLGVAYENLRLTVAAKASYEAAVRAGVTGAYDVTRAELNQIKLDFNVEKKRWEAAK